MSTTATTGGDLLVPAPEHGQPTSHHGQPEPARTRVVLLIETEVPRRVFASSATSPDDEVAMNFARFLKNRVDAGAAYLLDTRITRIALPEREPAPQRHQSGSHALESWVPAVGEATPPGPASAEASA